MTDRERKCREAAKKGFVEGIKIGVTSAGVVLGAIGLMVIGCWIGSAGTIATLEIGGISKETLDAALKVGANALE